MSGREAPVPLIRDSARLVVLLAMFLSVWMIGGFYPIARFMVLAMLTVGMIVVWVSGNDLKRSLSGSTAILLVMLCAILYGVLQIVPGMEVFRETGVSVIQERFGGGVSESSSQTLAVWLTQNWLAMAMIGIAAFVLSACLFNDESSRLMLLAAITICGVGQVLWGIIQLASRPDEVFFGYKLSGGSIPFGTFFNRNHAADFIGMSLACAIALLWRFSRSETRKRKLGLAYSTTWIHRLISDPLLLSLWIAVGLLFTGVVLSMSRGGWMSVAFGILIVPVCWRRKEAGRQYPLIAAAFVVFAASFFAVQFFGFGDKVGKRLDALEVQNLLADSRFDHWAEAIPAAGFYLPFGSGLGTYGYAYLPFDPAPERQWFTHAHNQYLEVVMEAGIPGVILLLLAMFFSIRICLKLCSGKRSGTKQAIGIAALASVVLQVIHAITDFGLMMPGNLVTMMALLGAASAAVELRNPDRIKAKATKEPSKSNGLGYRLLFICVLIALCCSLWHQGRAVRADSLLAATDFDAKSPAPTVDTTDRWIELLQKEHDRWPEHEPLVRRLSRLHMHRAQRTTYDQLRETERAAGASINPIDLWNTTTLESIIVRLFDETALTADQRQQIHKEMADEPNLGAAWQAITEAIDLNPVVPRLHLRMAQLGAASGRPWRKSLKKSTRLSVVNPKLSIGNGLLAWAAGDKETMVAQWRRSLEIDWENLNMVFAICSTCMGEDEIVNDLMPENWIVPYRLASQLKENEELKSLQEKLLARATQIASDSLTDKAMLHRSLGFISTAKGSFSEATAHYSKAASFDPTNAELRHLTALSLHREGKPKEAANKARIATMLAPNQDQFRDFYRRMIRLDRKNYLEPPGSSPSKTSNTQPAQ